MLRRLKIGEWTVPGALRFTTLRSLAKLNDLESLELHGLGLKSSEYRHLAGLVNLRNLRIEQSVLDDSAMKEIGKLRGLQLLTFNSGGVTDVGLEHLKSLTNLETLMFDLTNIQGPGLIHLYELKRLRYVLAAGCSDESKESLRKALPHCRVDWFSRFVLLATGQRVTMAYNARFSAAGERRASPTSPVTDGWQFFWGFFGRMARWNCT
jgi:hypothetical protein